MKKDNTVDNIIKVGLKNDYRITNVLFVFIYLWLQKYLNII